MAVIDKHSHRHEMITLEVHDKLYQDLLYVLINDQANVLFIGDDIVGHDLLINYVSSMQRESELNTFENFALSTG